jgi:mono/diheme cytochrome c family protein
MPPKTPTHAAGVALLLILALAGTAALAQAPAAPAGGTVVPASRGQALYTTHCIACHNTQVHWRDNKLATDWDSLKALVRRWQATAALAWSEADVVEVARYLNDSIYRHPQTSDRLSLLAAPR